MLLTGLISIKITVYLLFPLRQINYVIALKYYRYISNRKGMTKCVLDNNCYIWYTFNYNINAYTTTYINLWSNVIYLDNIQRNYLLPMFWNNNKLFCEILSNENGIILKIFTSFFLLYYTVRYVSIRFANREKFYKN